MLTQIKNIAIFKNIKIIQKSEKKRKLLFHCANF